MLNISASRLVSLSLSVVYCVSACTADIGDYDPSDVSLREEGLRNANLVDVSGAVVEVVNSASQACTGTLINRNSLITAAHCGTQSNSYTGNFKVLYQENSTTWRCLTGRDAMNNAITGNHATVLSACPWRQAGFGSMYDYGTDQISFPGDSPGETYWVDRHDFAVLKVWTANFTWVGTNSGQWAALYNDNISAGNEWSYGIGRTGPNAAHDWRVRRDQYNVQYFDNFVLGAFGANVQACDGDSGGPIGVFLPSTNKFAVVGTLADVEERDNGTGFCGQVNGATYWANAVSRIWYVEAAIGFTCTSVISGGVKSKQCF